MKEKKYIDRLYQEKFKDFEAVPREEVWKSISTKLQKEQRRRSIAPLWYRIAGFAALLALIFLLGDWFSVPQQTNGLTKGNGDVERFNESPAPEENRMAGTSGIQEEGSGSHTPTAEINKESTIRAAVDEHEKTNKILSVISSIAAMGQERKTLHFETTARTLQPETEKGIANATLKKKSIFEELSEKQKEEEIEKTVPKNRFEISTHAAPVFYGNLGEGSFLAPQFNNNETEAEITYSYGVQLAYAISKNLKIRSGINKITMSYNTLDVAYRSVIRPNAISSINYPKEQPDLQTSGYTHSKSITATSRARVGSIYGALLNQELGFLEIPISLEYNIIDKRFELNIIGGASTLILENNRVSVNSGNLTTTLGQANNLNDVSFSTNIGLGLDYNLTDKFKLNLEPIFKYQINTFNSKLMDYHPYYMAIYTGISFEF